jgi:mutator protein MutT
VAVVQRGAEVLIGKRALAARFGGLWEFPGGKVAPGETPQEAAARECREETGLGVRIGAPYLEVEYQDEQGPLRLHFFAAAAVDAAQAPRAPFRWVALSDLADYAFPPANAALIRLLVGGSEGAAGGRP